MKVVLVYPDFGPGAGGKYYEGIAVISSCLKKQGHEIKFIHLNEMKTKEDLYGEISPQNPDLIGFSATTNMFSYVADCCKYIKSKADVPIICGGIHPTLNPEEVINTDGIDMLSVGEAEDAVVELCFCLENKTSIDGIKNIWVKKKDKIIRNPIRPITCDLDSIALPDHGMFKLENLIESERRRITLLASRGCPYNCSYCCNHSLRQLYVGQNSSKYVRYKSVNYILDEIDCCLRSNPAAEYLYFYDDILTLNKKWFRDLAYSIKDRFKLPYVCNSRFNLIDEEIVTIFKDTGCFQVSFGLESGNEYIRNKILRRNIDEKDIITASKLCHKAGIKIYSYNIIAIPQETMPNVLDTVKLNAKILADESQVSIFYPYKGTALYDFCLKNGMLGVQTANSYFSKSILTSHTMTQQEIEFAKKHFGDFIRYYTRIENLPPVIRFFLNACLDFLWMNPNIYKLLTKIRNFMGHK